MERDGLAMPNCGNVIIFFRKENGSIFGMEFCRDAGIFVVKERIKSIIATPVYVTLSFGGLFLPDDATLEGSGIHNNAIVDMSEEPLPEVINVKVKLMMYDTPPVCVSIPVCTSQNIMQLKYEIKNQLWNWRRRDIPIHFMTVRNGITNQHLSDAFSIKECGISPECGLVVYFLDTLNDLQVNLASVMAAHADCKLRFSELMETRAHKFIVFKIEETQKQVIVEKLGDPSQGYQDFIASLPANECRYAVYNFGFMTDGILFIDWSPCTSLARSKIIYAGSKDSFKREFDGIQVELRATDRTGLLLDMLKTLTI